SLHHRDTSAMTLGVSKGQLPELKEKIRGFRREILKMVSQCEVPEEVVQLNIQFYPVTAVADS
ncbi:MAG: TIGR02147 family protein, partial [Deltaproteobacteria bacterium]|nr:TIGR02147 family protein [Deltaproteobacteria bacterium]